MTIKHILSEFQSGRLTLTEFEAALEKWRADDFWERAAIAAMQGVLHFPATASVAYSIGSDQSMRTISDIAAGYADAMLAERNKRMMGRA